MSESVPIEPENKSETKYEPGTTLTEALECGLSAQRTGNCQLVIEWMRKVLELDSSHREARILISSALRETGDLDTAESFYEELLIEEPELVHALIGLALCARQRRDLVTAENRLLSALSVAPRDRDARFEYATTLREAGRFDDAEVVYQDVILEFPTWFPALLGFGICARQRGDVKLAEARLANAVAASPRDRIGLLEHATSLRELGRLEQAADVYSAALAEEPNWGPALIGLGLCARQRRELAQAEHWLVAALRVTPDDFDARYEYATVLREVGRLDAAEVLYRKLLEARPEWFPALLGLGLCARQRGNLALAAERLKTAAAMAPFDRDVRYEYANTLRQQGETDKALALYRAVLLDSPGWDPATSALAVCLAQQSNFVSIFDSETQTINSNEGSNELDQSKGNSKQERKNAATEITPELDRTSEINSPRIDPLEIAPETLPRHSSNLSEPCDSVASQSTANEVFHSTLDEEALSKDSKIQLFRLLKTWNALEIKSSDTAYAIGKVFGTSGMNQPASRWYEMATKLPRPNPWASLELSELKTSEEKIADAASYTLQFLVRILAEPNPVLLDEKQKVAILKRSHVIFEGNKSSGRQLYAAAYNNGISDYLSILRLIEYALDNAQVDKAQSYMIELESRFKLDSFGLLALSRLLQEKNDIDSSVDSLRRAGELLPGNVWLRNQICFRLIELERYEEAELAINSFANDPLLDIEAVTQRLAALKFRLAVRQRRADLAFGVIDDYDFCWDYIEPWIFAEAVYAFAKYGYQWNEIESKLLSAIHGHLAKSFLASDNACLAVIHYQTAKAEWKIAEELTIAVSHLPIYQSRDMVIRRFEIACQLQKLDVAQGIYSSHWLGRSDLNLSESVLSMRFLAELKDWAGAADVIASLMTRGMSLPEDFYGVLQVIRRADEHMRFITLLSDLKREDSYARELLQLLIDDVCILHGVIEIGSIESGVTHRASQKNGILIKPATPALASASKRAALICSDRAYFVSVLTLLASLAPGIGNTADWFLFLSADVPEHWYELVANFAAKLGFEISIVHESKFFASSEGCPVDYGLFAGGRHLARSAYFRIYAANWLLRKQRYARAVYMDSDMICQGDVSGLFELNLGTASLAGRPEELSPAVARAAARCGVGAENYINSGVLVFNYEHPQIANHLHDAIWQSEHAGPRLTFHDQCALNIAFAGSITHLPPQYNTYLRPFRQYQRELTEGILLHYLDRPKPWDSTFTGSHRLPWLLAATVVKAVLPPKLFHEVAAAGMGKVQGLRSLNPAPTAA